MILTFSAVLIQHDILCYLIVASQHASFLHIISYNIYNIIGTLTQPANGSAAFSTFENGRRKMSLGIFNTLAGLSFDKSSSSDSSRRSSSPEVPVYDQVKRPRTHYHGSSVTFRQKIYYPQSRFVCFSFLKMYSFIL